MIMIKMPFVNDFIRGENGDPLVFNDIASMLRYLREKNYTLEMLGEFEYEELNA